MKSIGPVRWGLAAIVLALVSAGRWLNPPSVLERTVSAALLPLCYGLLAGAAAYIIVDLVLARGNLPFKITLIKLLLLVLALLGIFDTIFLRHGGMVTDRGVYGAAAACLGIV